MNRRTALTAAMAAALCATTAAVAAPRTTQLPAASYASHWVPSNLAYADFAGEPSIGADHRTGAVLYQAAAATLRLTLPAGTWTDVSSPITSFNIDPILATDSESGVTLAGGDDGGCSVLAMTADDGQSWRPALPCTVTPDHPTVGFGRVSGASAQSNDRIVYFCQQYPWENECAASRDDGLTWTPSIPVQGGCIGPSGHVKVSADGTAYLPINACTGTGTIVDDGQGGDTVGGAVSTDNGLTWNSYKIPAARWPIHGFDPSVATTPDNTVYETWTRYGDYRPMMAWSHDHGKSWSSGTDVAAGSPYPISTAVMPAAVAGDDGRVAVAYLGADRAPAPGTTAFDAGYVGAWYLYVSATYDAGRHWTTTRVLDRPVQLGPICDQGTKCLSGRNLLDFIDATITGDGRVAIAFASGCSGGCPADVSQTAKSTAAWGAVAVQSTGLSLYARDGRLSPQ